MDKTIVMKIEYIIIAGLFLWILFLSQCSEPKTVVKKERVVFHSSDTTVVHDTIIKEVEKHHWHVQPSNVPAVEYTTEQIAKMDTFMFEINDSILSAKISAISTNYPIINFNYKVKYFETKETIKIKDSLVVMPLKNEFFFGATIGGGLNQFIFAPRVSMKSKNDWFYSVGYDIIGKNLMLSAERKLTFFSK